MVARLKLWFHCLIHFHRSYRYDYIKSDGTRHVKRGCNDCMEKKMSVLISHAPLTEDDIKWARALERADGWIPPKETA